MELFRLYPDALRDTHAAAYALLVMAPLSSIVSHILIYFGRKTPTILVYIVSLAVPALALSVPMWYWPRERNVYELLSMSRMESNYNWSQKYAFYRKLYQEGSISPEAWREIDMAYDKIYNAQSRYVYDFWGPDHNEMSLTEMIVHVGLFYVLWIAIIYTVTTPKAAQAASKLSYVALVMMLAIEVTILLNQFDPVIMEVSPYTTPHESVLWCHRFFPIIVFAVVLIKRVFYLDLDKQHQRVLIHMLEKNIETMEELQNLTPLLVPKRKNTRGNKITT
ncbi:hypothetical protein CCR75_002853 [Bremia lactucae]|uniref:J domain-containing protein n=1 Tax=Bremia lactucae TaxID=4779 RepID=A0A976FM84_BRELC|nr:hypothetical protein CCR75_002853 [Bremia lactucae]